MILCSILVAVDYLGERATFTPEQLMAMLMVDEKAIAETDGSPVTDCVIAIPAYFSAEERRAMLDASQIAGINCLRLMPETTATALAYGIYKTDLPEKDPINVVFVDVGYSCLQVNPSFFPLVTPDPPCPLRFDLTGLRHSQAPLEYWRLCLASCSVVLSQQP